MRITNDVLTIKIENLEDLSIRIEGLDQLNNSVLTMVKMMEWYAANQIKLTQAYIQKCCNQTKCTCNDYVPKCGTAGQSPKTIELVAEPVRPVRQLAEKKAVEIEPVFSRTKNAQLADDPLAGFYRQAEMGKIRVEGKRVLTSDGEDLAKYMPWTINKKIDSDRTLLSVNCYKVVDSQNDPKQKNILFQWESTYLNSRYINEQTAYAYKKYY